MDVSMSKSLFDENELNEGARVPRRLPADRAQDARAVRRRLPRAGGATQAGTVAHNPKSSSRAIGARAIGDRRERTAAAGKSDDAAAVRAMTPSFGAGLRRVGAALDADLGKGVS